MDTPTHMMAAALAGEAFFRNRLGRAAPIVAAAACLAPDLDGIVIRMTGDSFDFLEHHRAISHSLVAMPVIAAAVASVTCLVMRRRRTFGWVFLCALVGGAMQPVLDVPTSWGGRLVPHWLRLRQKFTTSLMPG